MAPQYSEDLPVTEIDQLLPVNERKTYPIKTSRHAQSRPLLFASAAAVAFMLFSTFQSELKHKDVFRKEARSVIKRKQVDALSDLTTSKVNAATKKNIHLIRTQEPKRSSLDKRRTTVCTSQIMIMRHCEKDTKVKVDSGKVKTTDTTDLFGNRHCNVKGKARSEYIATLFDDPSEKQAAVNADGVRFPTPLQLYALSESRYKHQTKHHKNFREIETLEPTATKFNLSVDERFGVGDEVDLAFDVFETLSKSVAEGLTNATDLFTAEEPRGICNNGMVVVNWKHSRIPKLSAALGCGKKEGCPKKYNKKDFDTVWLLTFEYSIEERNGSKEAYSRKHLKYSPITFEGDWTISAQMIKEGFTYA